MRKVLRIIIVLIGASLGFAMVNYADRHDFFLQFVNEWRLLIVIASYVVFVLVGALAFLLLVKPFFKLLDRVESGLKNRPMADLVAGAIGLVIGLFLAFLLCQLINFIPSEWVAVKISISVLIYVLLGYGSMTLAVNRRHEFNVVALIRKAMASREGRALAREGAGAEETLSQKLLDTSVIIDGRIFEICKAGFLEGRLIVPSFVLDELRTISDSEDDLKRSRGRRGLDILARLQHELLRPVEVVNRDFSELSDVDSKLLKLAGEIGAKVITNDYNLNKVAKVQNIKVLNINELSNAVKPIALPGEEMSVKIVKLGKEQGQGVAYLDDGTMIVVEGGSRYIDETVQIIVTSSLQTSAGRMIFGRLV
jgi:uncharacterized protein YacL